MSDALVEASIQAQIKKFREAVAAAADQHRVVTPDFRADVQSLTTNFIESLKSRKVLASGGCTTHTIVKVEIEMPPQRGVRTYYKIYRAVCTLDPEAPPYVMVLKGVTRRRAKGWIRRAKESVGNLVNYLSFTPVQPINYIELKIHVENNRDNGSPRNGQELDAATSESTGHTTLHG